METGYSVPNVEERVKAILEVAKQNTNFFQNNKLVITDDSPGEGDLPEAIDVLKSTIVSNKHASEMTVAGVLEFLKNDPFIIHALVGFELTVAWVHDMIENVVHRNRKDPANLLISEWYKSKSCFLRNIAKYTSGIIHEVVPNETFVPISKEHYVPLKPLVEEHFTRYDTLLTVVPKFPFENIDYVKDHMAETKRALREMDDVLREMDLISEAIENGVIHKTPPNHSLAIMIGTGGRVIEESVKHEEADGILRQFNFPTNSKE